MLLRVRSDVRSAAGPDRERQGAILRLSQAGDGRRGARRDPMGTPPSAVLVLSPVPRPLPHELRGDRFPLLRWPWTRRDRPTEAAAGEIAKESVTGGHAGGDAGDGAGVRAVHSPQKSSQLTSG